MIGAFLADLSISISSSAPSNLGVGQQYSYVVTGTNAGPTLADNVVFTLVLSGSEKYRPFLWLLWIGAVFVIDETIRAVAMRDILKRLTTTKHRDESGKNR